MSITGVLARSSVLLFILAVPLFAPAESQSVRIGNFSSGDLKAWETKSFKGETTYRTTNIDGAKVLSAESAGAASGLFKKQRIDLTQTPFLHWRWRVNNGLGALNEQSKAGDDYAARVYVVVDGGLAFWRKKALNYVWASTSAKGKTWPNAYAGSNVMMVAVRSAGDGIGKWYDEKRNVREDLRQKFGEDITAIDALAIMTDTDNAGGKTVAYYGDIYFSAD